MISLTLRGMMSQPLSTPLQGGLRFFQPPKPALPTAFLADAPALMRRKDGIAMLSCNDTDELVPAYHTGSHCCPCAPSVQWDSRLRCLFWLEPVSIFGSLGLTMPEAVHLRWTYHPACSSDRIEAGSHGDVLAETSSTQGGRNVVTVASDRIVTNPAVTDRLLRTEPQVRLMKYSSRTIIVTPSCHTHAEPLPVGRIWRTSNPPQVRHGPWPST